MNLTSFTIALRKNQTQEEKLLWKKLKRKRLKGYKFRRQEQIGKYIVDFVCFEKKVVIELDGGHRLKKKEKDRVRDKWLYQQGFEVLRFWNNEVNEDIEKVINEIRQKLNKHPHLAFKNRMPSSPIKGEEKEE